MSQFSKRLEQVLQNQHGHCEDLSGDELSTTEDGEVETPQIASTLDTKKPARRNSLFFMKGDGNTGGELLRMIRAMDKDGDGRVSFTEMEWAITRHYEMTDWIHRTSVSLPEFVHALFM